MSNSRFAFQISPIQVLQISGLLETYMVLNFRIHKISRGTHKRTQTSILIIKKS